MQKTVLIVGAGLSGVDIAVDIATTAKTVMISAERGMVLNHRSKAMAHNITKDSLALVLYFLILLIYPLNSCSSRDDQYRMCPGWGNL